MKSNVITILLILACLTLPLFFPKNLIQPEPPLIQNTKFIPANFNALVPSNAKLHAAWLEDTYIVYTPTFRTMVSVEELKTLQKSHQITILDTRVANLLGFAAYGLYCAAAILLGLLFFELYSNRHQKAANEAQPKTN